MELKPLLDTLNKVSMGRVLPHADVSTEGEITIAKIPVANHNPADKSDVALRRFSADWLRKELKNISVDHRFEKVSGLSWHNDDGTEVPLVGIIYLTWWQRPEMSEFEVLKRLQEERRKAARTEDENPKS